MDFTPLSPLVSFVCFSAIYLAVLFVLRLMENEGYWTLRFRLALYEPYCCASLFIAISTSFGWLLTTLPFEEPFKLRLLFFYISIISIFSFFYIRKQGRSLTFYHLRYLSWTGPSRTSIPSNLLHLLGNPQDWRQLQLSFRISPVYPSDFQLSLLAPHGIHADPTDILKYLSAIRNPEALLVTPGARAGVYHPHHISKPVSLLWGSHLGFSPRCSRAIISVPRRYLTQFPMTPHGFDARPICLAYGILGRNKGPSPKTLVCGLLDSLTAMREFEENSAFWPRPAKTLRGYYSKVFQETFKVLGSEFVCMATELALLIADAGDDVVGDWLMGRMEQQDLELNWEVEKLGASDEELERFYRGQYAAMLVGLSVHKIGRRKRPELLVFERLCEKEGVEVPKWASGPEMRERREAELMDAGGNIEALIRSLVSLGIDIKTHQLPRGHTNHLTSQHRKSVIGTSSPNFYLQMHDFILSYVLTLIFLLISHASGFPIYPRDVTSARIIPLNTAGALGLLWSSIGLAVLTALIQGLVTTMASVAESSAMWTFRFRLARSEYIWWSFVSGLLGTSLIMITLSFLCGNQGEGLSVLVLSSATGVAIVRTPQSTLTTLAAKDRIGQLGRGIYDDGLHDFNQPEGNISLLWGTDQGFRRRVSRAIGSMPLNLLRSQPVTVDNYVADGLCLAMGILGRNKGLNPKSLVYGAEEREKRTGALDAPHEINSRKISNTLENTSTWKPRPAKVLRSYYVDTLKKQYGGISDAYVAASVELALILADADHHAIRAWFGQRMEQQDYEFNRELQEHRQSLGDLGPTAVEFNALYRGSYVSMVISLNYMNYPFGGGANSKEGLCRPDLTCMALLLMAEGAEKPKWWEEKWVENRLQEERKALSKDESWVDPMAWLFGLEKWPDVRGWRV
ncbi:hypothetical protein BZA77DRAFT_248940 [Pyronema omphalodes]|nr:hypothetical protein BZA77DRAFT_248940 [Pyronema omphalodes]